MPVDGISPTPKTPQRSEAADMPNEGNVVDGLPKVIGQPFSNGGEGLKDHRVTAGAPPESAVVNKVATVTFDINPFNVDAKVYQAAVARFEGNPKASVSRIVTPNGEFHVGELLAEGGEKYVHLLLDATKTMVLGVIAFVKNSEKHAKHKARVHQDLVDRFKSAEHILLPHQISWGQGGVTRYGYLAEKMDGELKNITSPPLPPTMIKEVMRQAALAVQELHKEGYVHFDIKEQNFLYKLDQKDGKWSIRVYLTDFDFAAKADEKNELRFSGTTEKVAHPGLEGELTRSKGGEVSKEFGVKNDLHMLKGMCKRFFEGPGDGSAAKDNQEIMQSIEAAQSIDDLLVISGSSSESLEKDDALVFECLSGSPERVEELIKEGANIKWEKEGSSLLHLAAVAGKTEIVKLLIEKGLDPSLQDAHGRSALHFACESLNASLVDLLLKKGADAKLADNDNVTPLFHATFDEEEQKEFIEMAEAFIKNNQSVLLKNDDNETLLHKSAFANCEEIMQFLVENDVDINAQDSAGNTALHYAVGEKNHEATEFLLNLDGIDQTIKNNGGRVAFDL